MARSTFRVLFYTNGSKEKNGIVPIHGEVLPESRLQRAADRHAHQRQAAVLRRRTILGGTQAEVHDREGCLPSGERPGGQIQTRTCHQRATDWRMVQRTIQ